MRSTTTRIAAAGTTALTVLVLGSPPVGDYVIEDLPSALDSFRRLASTLIRARYWFSGFELQDNLGLASFGIVLVVLVALLAGFAATSTSAMARFLAGWGVVLAAAAVAGLVQALYLHFVTDQVFGVSDDLGEVVFAEIETAVGYAFWTGWLVAAVIAVVGRHSSTIVSSSAHPPAQPWSPGPPPGSGWDPPPPAPQPHPQAPAAAPGPEDPTRLWNPPPAP